MSVCNPIKIETGKENCNGNISFMAVIHLIQQDCNREGQAQGIVQEAKAARDAVIRNCQMRFRK